MKDKLWKKTYYMPYSKKHLDQRLITPEDLKNAIHKQILSEQFVKEEMIYQLLMVRRYVEQEIVRRAKVLKKVYGFFRLDLRRDIKVLSGVIDKIDSKIEPLKAKKISVKLEKKK